MKYPFFGWRCARNKDYLLPKFRTLQSPTKTNSIYIVDIIPIGRETDALGEIQHHQAFDSFWGRSISYVESIQWWKPASEKNKIMKTINRQSIKRWKPATHPVPIIIILIRPVMPRGKENLMALLHYPQKVTITRMLENVTFKTGKNFATTVFETKKTCISRLLLICNKSAFMVLIGIKPMKSTFFTYSYSF